MKSQTLVKISALDGGLQVCGVDPQHESLTGFRSDAGRAGIAYGKAVTLGFSLATVGVVTVTAFIAVGGEPSEAPLIGGRPSR